MIFKHKTPQYNHNGERGAIFRLWEDPGEQNNLILDQSLERIKAEAYDWMGKEIQGARLALHGSNYSKHAIFYKSLLPSMKWGDKPNPNHPFFE